MNRVDGVILGVGVVVLAASIVGVILYDDTAGATYEVSFQESSTQELAEQTEGGAAGDYTFEAQLNETGMANAVWAVEVSRNGLTNGDSVTVEITGPGGLTGDCTFSLGAGVTASGSCEATSEIQDAPSATTINAENASAAEEQARSELAAAGVGTWNATVTIAGGSGGVGPAAASYSVTVTPGYTLWEPNAQAPTPGTSGGP